ncbi:interleukin-13 receptor subunit alpha-1 isoform X2 [Spea bombifrons]|uniref:interleukin-13 receptor subunit alpha-1 isoform X2 n=1 Tax=Spea bombifrons TaxID=233779 RepID=UPI00234BA5FA|nr:interleukin-13 receptor subunit alpha-1 isoform X2 [Spea bombifrons]
MISPKKMWARTCWQLGMDLGFWLSVGFLTGSVAAASERNDVFPPYNITMKMNVFNVLWEWSPLIDGANCTVFYTSIMSAGKGNMELSFKNIHPNCTHEVENIDLNGFIPFKVEAGCKDKTQVKLVNMSVEVLSGNPKTAVRDFSCVWYDYEYINCTWHPGTEAPPKANYSLFYWLKSQSSDMALKPVHPMIFEEFLETGKVCHHYNYKDGTSIGCYFEYQQLYNLEDSEEMQIVVTDRLQKHIRPFVSYVKVYQIVQLSPPTITNISWTENALSVIWTVAKGKIKDLNFEVIITDITNGKHKEFKLTGINSKEFPDIYPYADYTVKVRGRIREILGSYPWSEWSKEETCKGKDSGRTTSLTLLILIPIILTVLAIFLVICMKRLKYIICPPIPDPGKVLKKSFGDPNTFQHFIKRRYEKVNVWNMAQKEEVCSVISVEPTTCSSQTE